MLFGLPEWFGLPDSTQDYIDNSRTQDFAAAFSGDEPVGFITLAATSPCTVELHVMGILKDYHRQGIGKQLVAWAVAYARSKGYTLMQVKTLDESAHNAQYDRTRAFYRAMGFMPLECFPTLWDKWNPCLVMVLPL